MLSAIDIINDINKQLEMTWTNFEWEHGKKVIILPEWLGRTEFILAKYRKAGWKVKKEATISSVAPTIDVYFIFFNPMSCAYAREPNKYLKT
jgi:hypothetical protein